MSAILIFRDTTNRLGGAATTTQVSATALNNIYDDVSPAEALAGDTEYRAIDIYNSGDAAAVVAAVYMSAETTSPKSSIDMGIESSPLGSILSTADESTAPANVTFAHKTNTAKLSLPDIPAGSYCRLWLKRIILAAAANLANDTGTITTEYA